MKFCDITFKPLKKLLTLLFTALVAFSIQAQNASNSPYSRFGVGDLQSIQTPRNVAMGGISTGLTGLHNVSNRNPASYINLDSNAVIFELSFRTAFSELSEKQIDGNTLKTNTNNASLGQISLAFPITSWLKASFGLTPKSAMGYDVLNEGTTSDGLAYNRRHQGQGGLNQGFFGLALGTSRVSVGANINYNFGSYERSTTYAFVRDSMIIYPSYTSYEKSLDAQGVSFDIGAQYRQPLPNNYQLGIGLTYSPGYSLNASRSEELLSIFSNGLDTLLNQKETGTLKMPAQYSFGLSLEKLERWVIGAEYSLVDFSNYEEFSRRDASLIQAKTFRVGAELMGQRTSNNFMGAISYRIGYHTGTGYVSYHDAEIKQFGISVGLGIPIRRMLSRLDVAFEFGRRGSLDAGQIQENYGRITLGITAFERWFVRGKFE